MSEAEPSPRATPIDWEAFYRNYRNPGYVPGFEITSKLGGGMFGLVFKAKKQSIGRNYAIKFLKVDDEDVQRAVLGELDSVRYFAQVDHPNLVSIEDRGEVDGIPYIVMAFAGSETLRDRMSAPDADPEQLLSLFMQACRGVQALHERSLVHFDLKPANIFIAGNVARVGDYGLSKLVAHSRNSLSMGRGTPYYMAPEMLQRRGDGRSDLYSLGVILYECLTGELPFRGDSEWEVLRKHETEPVSFPDNVEEVFRGILRRCLAKDPDDRFANVAELIEALRTGVVLPAGDPSTTRAHEPTASVEDVDPTAAVTAAAAAASEAIRNVGVDAGRVANDAMRRARRASERAIASANRAVDHAVRAASTAAERKREARAAGVDMSSRWPRRRRRGSRGMMMFAGFIAVFILFWMTLLVSGDVSSGIRVEGRPTIDRSAVPVPVPVPMPVGAAAAETPWPHMVVREGRLVRELPTPVWSSATDDQVAARTLRAELNAWKATVPQTRLQLESISGKLPWYVLRLPANEEKQKGIRNELKKLMARKDYDTALARDIGRAGYPALVQGIMLLEEQNMMSKKGLQQAQKVNRFLNDLTGVDAIRIHIDSQGRKPDPNLKLNQSAGTRWRWFVHEFLQDSDSKFDKYRKYFSSSR